MSTLTTLTFTKDPFQLMHFNSVWTKIVHHLVLNVCVVYVFGVGYMVGYLCHRKPREVAKCEPNIVYTENKDAADSAAFISHESEMQLNWGDITKLLKQKLTSQAFTKTLRYTKDMIVLVMLSFEDINDYSYYLSRDYVPGGTTHLLCTRLM